MAARPLLSLLVLSVLSQSAFATNYALIVGGGSGGFSDERATSHQFATGIYKTAAGLAGQNWQTTVFYTGDQSKGGFVETRAIESLRGQGVSLKPSHRGEVLGALRALKTKIGPGDKVFLTILAHGGQNKNGGFSFGVTDPRNPFIASPITAQELSAILKELKATGAKIGVHISSCHSGDFSPELLGDLRGNDGHPGICVITSSLPGANSEACMGTDFNEKGEYRSSYNRSHTATGGFLTTWLLENGGKGGPNPFPAAGGKCWEYEKQNYDACLKRAEEAGIPLTRRSSLKEILRVGRLCDQSSNFPDSTGKQNGLGQVLKLLGGQALLFVYGHSEDGRHAIHQINPYSTHSLAEEVTKTERAIVTLEGGGDSDYGRALYAKLAVPLREYRSNLVAQKQKLAEYQKLLEAPFDRDEVKRILGDLVEKLERQWRAPNSIGGEVRKSGAGRKSDDDGGIRSRLGEGPPPAPPTWATVSRTQLILDLQNRYLRPSTSVSEKSRILEALQKLNGGEAGQPLLREIIEQQRKQHAMFLNILKGEREAYDQTLGREKDSCSDFTIQ